MRFKIMDVFPFVENSIDKKILYHCIKIIKNINIQKIATLLVAILLITDYSIP